jgi:single-strand DNA-binding protein
MDVNKITLLGRVGQEPVLSYTQSGKAMLKFSVATGVSWKKDDGEWETKTSWHNIVCWGKSAEYLNEKVNKGERIYIEGSIDYQKYEKDGETKYFTSITAGLVIPIATKGSNQGGNYEEPDTTENNSEEDPF